MAFQQATDWACECIQVYTTPSRRWEVPDLSKERVAAFFGKWSESPVVTVVAHVPFLVNLASADEEARRRSLRRLIQEIHRADELKVASVILHPGSGGSSLRTDALDLVAAGLREALAETAGSGVRVLIENMAGQGATLCGRFEEIAMVLSLVDDATGRLGVCFDTAHAFIAGYPLVGYDGYRDVMDEFDRVVGCDRIFALHVNDALTNHGSRHDRHAPVGEGRMDLAVFHALVRDARFAGTPMVLEVPDRDGKSLQALEVLRELRAKAEPIKESSNQVQFDLFSEAHQLKPKGATVVGVV